MITLEEYHKFSALPSPKEKKNIRKVFTGISVVLLSAYILTEIFGFIGYNLVYKTGAGYIYSANGIRVIQPWEMLIMGFTPGVCFLLVFFGYHLIKHKKFLSMFNTKNVTSVIVIKAIILTLLCQELSTFLNVGVMTFLEFFNLEVTYFDYEISTDFVTISGDLISSIIFAPIAEELFFRGIILRNTAKISQNFAIFFSALIFGLMHGNPYQLVGGFLMGVSLGYFTIKTGSLVPAIIAHIAVNFNASIGQITDLIDVRIYDYIYYPLMILILGVGFITLAVMKRRGELKLPAYTDYHRKRTFPILITCPSLILMFIIYFYDIISSVSPIQQVIMDDSFYQNFQKAFKFIL